jgi:hypothetical protein
VAEKGHRSLEIGGIKYIWGWKKAKRVGHREKKITLCEIRLRISPNEIEIREKWRQSNE